MNNEYKKIWGNRYFLSPDTKNWKPFKGWDKEDRKHLVLLIIIKKEDIVKKIEMVQHKLSLHNSYIRFPKRYYHVTLKPLGFLDDLKKHLDDYSKKELDEIIKNIERVLLKESKFKLELKSVNLFKDAVFIEIDDKNKLTSINKKILNIPKINALKRDYPNFLPHCSIGTYRSNKIKDLIGEIKNFREFSFGKMVIDRIQLVIAHWHNTKYPKFEIIKSFRLKKKSLSVFGS
ncbi:MAG: 2'-5' RNA ligase family protein [Nanoarchaeota archaeon]